MTTTRALTLALLALAGALPAAAQTAYSVRSDGTGATEDFLFAIDLATGAATALGATGFGDVESLAFAPGCGTLYGVDDVTDRLVTCDTATGACTAVGPLGVDVTDTGLAFGGNGILYMSTDAPKNPTNLYRLNPETGAATLIGDQRQAVTGLAANRVAVYGLGGDGTDNLATMNLTLGRAAAIGPLVSVTLQDGGLDFNASGLLYGINDTSSARGNPSQVFRLNPATGAATVVATVRVGTTPVNGFESLAIADGICSELARQAELEVPTASGWGLAALALALSAAGLLVVRRLP